MNSVKKLIYQYVIPLIGRSQLHRNQYCNVIYYHDIVNGNGDSFMRTNKELFVKQMHYLRNNGFETLRFDDLNDPDKLQYCKKRVLVAFDDGWLSNYTEIFDLMKSLGIKYNVFLTVGEIGNNNEYLNWDMVREMYDSGIVGFGTHTYTHPHVGDMIEINPKLEFNQADEVFKQELGFQPFDFCYPFGSCSEKAHRYLTTNSHYKRIYTSSMMYSYEQNGCIIFGRNGISNDESFGVYKAKLNGLFNVWKTIIH